MVGHEGARARVRLDGPAGRVVGVKPRNLTVAIGLLDLLKEKVLFKEEAGGYPCPLLGSTQAPLVGGR